MSFIAPERLFQVSGEVDLPWKKRSREIERDRTEIKEGVCFVVYGTDVSAVLFYMHSLSYSCYMHAHTRPLAN